MIPKEIAMSEDRETVICKWPDGWHSRECPCRMCDVFKRSLKSGEEENATEPQSEGRVTESPPIDTRASASVPNVSGIQINDRRSGERSTRAFGSTEEAGAGPLGSDEGAH